MFDIPAEWASAFVIGLVTAIGHKIWNTLSRNKQTVLVNALAETKSVIWQLIATAPPGTTPEQIIIWAKGAAAIQLAKVGLKPDANKVVQSGVDAIIAAAVHEFVVMHPNPKSLVVPIQGKLTAAAIPAR
jgi:hypothetical protein